VTTPSHSSWLLGKTRLACAAVERAAAARVAALCAAATCSAVACSGDAFDTGPTEIDVRPDGEGGEGSGPGVAPVEVDVEPRLDVDPATVLADLSQAQRSTLCGDVLRVFNADVDNVRYREVYCTDLAWDAPSGNETECADAYQLCLEQVPVPVLSDRVEGSLGCDAGRERFVTPAGAVNLDSACATVGQTLDCWRAFGVAYERGFMDAVASAPRSCEDALASPPDLSAQVGFGIPRSCDQLVATAADCN
jgi:hypothetical protein